MGTGTEPRLWPRNTWTDSMDKSKHGLPAAMTRRCSHCGHNGHNSRTCPDRGVRIFGVRLADNFMRKSVSTGNLNHYATSSASPTTPEHSDNGANQDGYTSDGCGQSSSNTKERKKGVPWTEEEHRLFLIGLNKLGKGDWRGISRNFVQTRTPTQVASHAQKYFIRQNNLNKRKRRSSLFDIGADMNFGKGLGRSMSTPSLPTLAEDTVQTPESPVLNKQQAQDQKTTPYLSTPMLSHSQPNHLQLSPSPFLLPPLFDINCTQNFPPGMPPFNFPGHFSTHRMGFHMPIPMMHNIGTHGIPVDLTHPLHSSKQVSDVQLPSMMEECNESEPPAGASKEPQVGSWARGDSAASRKMDYETMAPVKCNQMEQEDQENKEQESSSISPSDGPKEETASSWHKSDEEEESASITHTTGSEAPRDRDHAVESDEPVRAAPREDNFFQPIPFQNTFMYGQFPIPWQHFGPPGSFLVHPNPPPVNMHPGILRPRPSMAPFSTLLPPRDGGVDINGAKIGVGNGSPTQPSPLTLKLLEGQDRQSAFHPKSPFAPSVLNSEPRDIPSLGISVV